MKNEPTPRTALLGFMLLTLSTGSFAANQALIVSPYKTSEFEYHDSTTEGTSLWNDPFLFYELMKWGREGPTNVEFDSLTHDRIHLLYADDFDLPRASHTLRYTPERLAHLYHLTDDSGSTSEIWRYIHAFAHGGHSSISLSVSEDTGLTILPEQQIPGSGYGQYPALWTSQSGRLYVGWDFYNSGAWNDARFAFSPDHGSTFLSPVNPSDAPYGTDETDVAVAANEGGDAYVAWQDTRHDPTGFNDDIYFATGTLSAIAETRSVGTPVGTFRIAPNPTRAPVRIEVGPQPTGPVMVSVFDLSGRVVRELAEYRPGLGRSILSWDGRDAEGNSVRTGVYFIRIQASGESRTLKLHYLEN